MARRTAAATRAAARRQAAKRKNRARGGMPRNRQPRSEIISRAKPKAENLLMSRRGQQRVAAKAAVRLSARKNMINVISEIVWRREGG